MEQGCESVPLGGTLSLEFRQREDGTQLDRLILSNDQLLCRSEECAATERYTTRQRVKAISQNSIGQSSKKSSLSLLVSDFTYPAMPPPLRQIPC